MNHISRGVRVFNEIPIDERHIREAHMHINYMRGDSEWSTMAIHDYTFSKDIVRYFTPHRVGGPIIKGEHFVETQFNKSKLLAAIKKNIVGMTELKKVYIFVGCLSKGDPCIIYEKTE